MSLAVDVLARPHGAVRRRDCLVSNEWRAPYTLASRYDAQQMSLAFLPSRRTAVALGVLTLLNALHHSDPVDNFKVPAMRPLMTPHPDDLGEDRPVFGVPQQIVQEIRPAAALDDGFMFTAPQDLPWMQHVFQPLGTPLALLMATEEA